MHQASCMLLFISYEAIVIVSEETSHAPKNKMNLQPMILAFPSHGNQHFFPACAQHTYPLSLVDTLACRQTKKSLLPVKNLINLVFFPFLCLHDKYRSAVKYANIFPGSFADWDVPSSLKKGSSGMFLHVCACMRVRLCMCVI